MLLYNIPPLPSTVGLVRSLGSDLEAFLSGESPDDLLDAASALTYKAAALLELSTALTVHAWVEKTRVDPFCLTPSAGSQNDKKTHTI